MGSKLFVGNLPFDTDDAALRQLFESTGKTVVEVAIMKDRMTGRPRGFAFVTLESEEDAKAAVSALANAEIGGRKLAINEAAPRAPRPMGGGDMGRGGFGGGGGGGFGGGGGGGFGDGGFDPRGGGAFPKAGGSRRKRRQKRML